MKKRYWYRIILDDLKWGYKTRQPTYIFSTVHALANPHLFPAWINQHICRQYRKHSGNGLAFSKSFDGLPTLYGELPYGNRNH